MSMDENTTGSTPDSAPTDKSSFQEEVAKSVADVKKLVVKDVKEIGATIEDRLTAIETHLKDAFNNFNPVK